VNRSQPLWMPRGSVRSIIALAFVFASIAGVFQTLGAPPSQGIPAGLAMLLSITALIVKDYFGDRKSDPPTPTGISVTSTKEASQ